MKWYCVLIALAVSGGLLSADSLWDDRFQGYIAGSSAFKVGDIVTIVIDSSLNLSFSSVSKDAKSITFEFTGGEYGGLFSFLPRAKTGDDRSVNGKESYSLKTEIAAGVTAVDPAGKLVVSGTRTVQFGGKQESVAVSGRVDPKAVDASGRFNFSRIEGARLSFTSFLQPAADTLTGRDIREIARRLEGTNGAGATEETTLQLTDQKKRELILLYLNRLIDIIFR